MLQILLAPVSKSDNAHGRNSANVSWNAQGEPATRQGDCVALSTIQKLIRNQKLTCDDPDFEEWMLVYFDFSMPSKELWNKPLLRVFGSKPVLQKQNGVNFLSITFATYFSRLIFYLIAYTPLAFVMNHLDPVKLVDVPLTTLPAFSPSFVSESRHELDKFSLAGFLAAHENPGYRVAEQPPGLALELKAYQLQTLAWMQDHEEMPGMGLNSLFWEERSFLDEGKFYYFPAAGELRL